MMSKRNQIAFTVLILTVNFVQGDHMADPQGGDVELSLEHLDIEGEGQVQHWTSFEAAIREDSGMEVGRSIRSPRSSRKSCGGKKCSRGMTCRRKCRPKCFKKYYAREETCTGGATLKLNTICRKINTECCSGKCFKYPIDNTFRCCIPQGDPCDNMNGKYCCGGSCIGGKCCANRQGGANCKGDVNSCCSRVCDRKYDTNKTTEVCCDRQGAFCNDARNFCCDQCNKERSVCCLSSSNTCKMKSECCSGICSGERCCENDTALEQPADTDCQDDKDCCSTNCGPDAICCVNSKSTLKGGAACNRSDECCSGSCKDRRCCVRAQSGKLVAYDSCKNDTNCCSGSCVNGKCCLPESKKKLAARASCTADTDCCNLRCGTVTGERKTCCFDVDHSCTQDEDCCVGKCVNKYGILVCKSPKKKQE